MADALLALKQHALWQFMLKRYTKSSRDATVTGMGELNGKWLIPDNDYHEFLNLLHDYLFVKKLRPLGFVEQPRLNATKPLLIDLDFHYSKSGNLNRRFTDEHIEAFCKELINAYDHFFDLSEHETMRFFVSVRPQPYSDKDKIKDGIHIVSPDGALSNDKWNVMRSWLLSRNIISKIFGQSGYMNKDEDVYDPSMGRKQGWMFYGASKPSVPAYEVKQVLAYTPSSGTWNEEDISEYDDRKLLEIMSVRYKVQPDVNNLWEERRDEFQMILARSQRSGQETLTNEEEGSELTTTTLNQTNEERIESANPPLKDEMDLIRRFVLECLSEERASDHDQWMRVCWCLHNIDPSDEMFHLWIEFTKKSPKWEHHRKNEVGQFYRDWRGGMRKIGDGPRLTRRSLYKWARDDNKEKYDEIIKSDTCEYIIEYTDATHYHIARLMKKMWDSLYVASVNSRSTDWFYYDEALNMWRKLNQGMELRQRICFDVANQIGLAGPKVKERYTGKELKKEDEERYQAKMKQIYKMQMSLYNSGFCDGVMKMCCSIFNEPDFVNKLNINPYLFGCANGVLELRHKTPEDPREHVIFRQGRPEDYVSFLAGKNFPETDAIPYVPYDPNDPRQAEIQDFFCKLFPREDLRKHVVKLLASCLEGANREQLYYFFIGVGSNGKSKLVTLMKLVLGDYQTSLQSTVLTRKRPESGAANPDIMAMKGRRFIYSQEPDDKEPLNTSRMKQMSGEDMVEARGMYQDQEKFKIMGKMFMMCNSLPPINSMDNGTWRRIRVIPFESRFEEADHPDLKAGKPNFYPRDNSLDEKLMTWREPFLSYLVHIYDTEYIPYGLQPEPLVVKQESERYKADHDTFAQFRMERIRERRDGYEEVTNEKYTIKEIKKAYDRWASAKSARKMDLKDLERRCEEAFGDSRGKREYSHIRVFLEEDDVEEFDRQHQENA